MIVRQQPLHFIHTDWYKAEESFVKENMKESLMTFFVEENIYHQVHALSEKKNDADICLIV